MADILPCPFCGADAHISQPLTINGRVHAGTVACSSLNGCFAPHVVFGPDKGDRAEDRAVALWNTRAEPQA